MIEGTHLAVNFVDVIDGDTIAVRLPNETTEENLRLLCLDTEESYAISGKPVTPWGKAAKSHAQEHFANAQQITIEFPGNEDLSVCLRKYRDNYGRLLVFAHYQDEDFQQHMIARGYSPYFCKYGYAAFDKKHRLYYQAEAQAQENNLGVWNQMEVNGTIARDYPQLSIWWHTRANRIDKYRRSRSHQSQILNTRLDYEELLKRAQLGQQATIFTELAYIIRAGVHGLVSYGSEAQPFNIFIPRLFSEEMQPMLNLLNHRYLGNDEKPALSYVYIQGELSMYQGKPQVWLRHTSQLNDLPPVAAKYSVYISALLPNPENADAGAETITLHNAGTQDVNLDNWNVMDRSGRRFIFGGDLSAGDIKSFTLPAYTLTLNNTGDELYLYDDQQQLQQHIRYEKQEVQPGESLHFPAPVVLPT